MRCPSVHPAGGGGKGWGRLLGRLGRQPAWIGIEAPGIEGESLVRGVGQRADEGMQVVHDHSPMPWTISLTMSSPKSANHWRLAGGSTLRAWSSSNIVANKDPM